ncbi:hypothetical protein TNCV_5126111 [Trichonephila clavipes]|nr:hypothetical protein TNCV_5126111 [Trichonephila clavipes]
MAIKTILEFVQSQKNIDADSDDKNKMNNVAPFPTSSSYLAAHCNGEKKNEMDDIKQFVDNLKLKKKIPDGFELANMVATDAKMVAKLTTNLVSKNDANLALPPRFRQVLIESPL